MLSHTYIGAGQLDPANPCPASEIYITEQVPIHCDTGEPVTNGWAGTYHDFDNAAHGAYATIDDARNAVYGLFKTVHPIETTRTSVVEAYERD